MAKTLNPDEVVERARRAQEDRLTVVRGLAEAEQNVTETRKLAAERVAEAEREAKSLVADAERAHVREYQAATRAGWSADELKGLGFSEPEKTARTRKRAPKKAATPKQQHDTLESVTNADSGAQHGSP